MALFSGEYSDDDAVYVIAIRSSDPKNGKEVRTALDSLREHVVPVTSPVVVAQRAGDCSPRMNDALRTLGFTFDEANSIVVVASDAS